MFFKMFRRRGEFNCWILTNFVVDFNCLCWFWFFINVGIKSLKYCIRILLKDLGVFLVFVSRKKWLGRLKREDS